MKTEGKILCASGHRPGKLNGYEIYDFTVVINLALLVLQKLKPAKIISGMAMGWDLAIATAAWELGIPFIAAIPFKGQQDRWTGSWKDVYLHVLKHAAEIQFVSDPGYAGWKMHARNEWMVNNSDGVIALWDGSSGGTGHCLGYARKQGKPIINCWKKWLEFTSQVPTDFKTTVVHCKLDKHDVYIGRGTGGEVTDLGDFGCWGNPVVKGKICPICGYVHSNNGDTLPCYERYLDQRLNTEPEFEKEFLKLKGKVLGCFCSPGPCHGDVMAKKLEEDRPFKKIKGGK